MKNGKKTWKRIAKIVGWTFLAIAVVLLGVSVYFTVCGYRMYRDVVDTTDISALVEEIRSRDTYTELSDLPDLYINGVVAVEDGRFYSHSGIDIISILRALFRNIIAMDVKAGGSTITQQTAKNLFFTNEKKLERKVAEVFMVDRLEDMYSKDEILEIYVNIIDFGCGYSGIYEAAVGYYGKEPSELDASECAMLIGIPNAPHHYSPAIDPVAAEEKYRYVVEQLIECGLLEEEFLQAMAFPEVKG